MERHRLQKLVLNHLSLRMNWAQLSMLHVAPEGFFQQTFRSSFRNYDTADLEMPGVDFHVDLCDLPFEDASYDVIYASHVLHHIENDMDALAEICRVLKPGGFAVLPVPIVASPTIEYPQAKSHEHFFWRAPGRDYFNKYRRVFSRVDEYDSEHFAPSHQTYLHEDRTIWPTPGTVWRRPMPGTRHAEVVPVCYK